MFARSRTVRCWIIVSAAAVALAGVSTSLAAADGSIVGWGSKQYGQLNVGPPNSGFVAVASAYEHSLGLKADGSILGDDRADTYRASASGSGKTNLTADLDTRWLSGTPTTPIAWR